MIVISHELPLRMNCPDSKVMTTLRKDDGNASEQSYMATAEMILHVFSCVAYIREFFPDDTYVDCKFGDMTLKKIFRSVNRQADTLVDWIEQGCSDALRNKYLETLTMAIYADADNPESILESYTMSFSYPSSNDHKVILKLRTLGDGTTKQVEIDQEAKISPSSNAPIKQQMIKMIRTLCILMQTLAALPAKKYVTMQMTYYDELTPTDYEPPGFTSAVFDLSFLFKKATFKHDFGVVQSDHHRIRLSLETAVADGQLSLENDPQATTVVPKIDSPMLEAGEARHETQETIVPESVHNEKEKDKEKVHIEPVHCMCGDVDTDLDMIFCDQCKTWQHTPCAGYCTNKDKRIPEKYACFKCSYKGNKKLLRNLQELASFRRAISVVYSEGLESITWLSKRLDCGVAKASKLIRRLESEGLVSKPNSQMKVFAYVVHKTTEAKSTIRRCFGQDLTVFPELAEFFSPKKTMKREKKSMVKRRKSVTAEQLVCM